MLGRYLWGSSNSFQPTQNNKEGRMEWTVTLRRMTCGVSRRAACKGVHVNVASVMRHYTINRLRWRGLHRRKILRITIFATDHAVVSFACSSRAGVYLALVGVPGRQQKYAAETWSQIMRYAIPIESVTCIASAVEPQLRHWSQNSPPLPGYLAAAESCDFAVKHGANKNQFVLCMKPLKLSIEPTI